MFMSSAAKFQTAVKRAARPQVDGFIVSKNIPVLTYFFHLVVLVTHCPTYSPHQSDFGSAQAIFSASIPTELWSVHYFQIKNISKLEIFSAYRVKKLPDFSDQTHLRKVTIAFSI